MLQQTQVSRVLEKFEPFMARFPDVRSLAAAGEDEVLAAWSGLGYYRRARQLHAAAKAIVERHEGVLPSDVMSLRDLPGVGRYTAGAIASIVFHRPEAAVDGNIARVLLRIEGREADETPREREAWVWERAEALVALADNAGPLNEGLMELGAMVCTPASPRCDECPVARRCAAFERDAVDRIPPPKAKPAQREVFHASVVVRDERGRLLLEQRSRTGMWAGMWQTPTLERDDRPHASDEVASALGLARVRERGSFTHVTTHRVVRIDIWEGSAAPRSKPARGTWMTVAQAEDLAMSNAQRRVLELIAALRASSDD